MNYQTENRHHNAQKNVVKGTGEYNTDNGCETCTPKKRNKEALRQVNREKQTGVLREKKKCFCQQTF